MLIEQALFVLCFCFPIFFCSTIQRFILGAQEWLTGLSTLNFTGVMFNGLVSDAVASCYLVPIAVCIMSLASFEKLKTSTFWKLVISILVIFNSAFWVWAALSEWYFWQDFSTRFNFIAVDYLVYTKEVAGNIAQSFSLPIILGGWLGGTLLVSLINFKLFKIFFSDVKERSPRLHPLAFIILPGLAWLVNCLPLFNLNNVIANDLSKNGVYEFFSAFQNNELSFKKLYANISEGELFSSVEKELESAGFKLKRGRQGQWIKIPKVAETPKKKLNLIIITVESLGGRFIGTLGNTKGITPYLDQLSEESMFFTNLYATGTRTVRGLEALTLSLPPTPGASIVRRKKTKNLMSIGGLLNALGYESKFIYGGHGLFDNMNHFFRVNNYKIVDRTDLTSEEITFANVWGVADEDILNRVLKESDESYSKRRPFFSMVLTTSNHRPFTYPKGKIDIPPHTGRDGGVKYTDYAIGKFLEDAKNKAWFRDTIFVIVADHSADGRGVIDVPVETYHIPMWIYAPALIQPQKIERVASQIDVIPTVLEILGIKAPNMFMGKNILAMTQKEERFFAGTYQKVGMYADGTFTSLGPKAVVENHEYNPITRTMTRDKIEKPEMERRTIANYQYASWLYSKGHYYLNEVLDDFLKH